MDKFVTIETNYNIKHPVTAGYLCAKNVSDAYDQVKTDDWPNKDVLIIKANAVNQLIVDLGKIARKL